MENSNLSGGLIPNEVINYQFTNPEGDTNYLCVCGGLLKPQQCIQISNTSTHKPFNGLVCDKCQLVINLDKAA